MKYLLWILWAIAGSIYAGYVSSWLWLWFVVPLGAPPIGTAWAIGLGCLVSRLSLADIATPVLGLSKVISETVIWLSLIWLTGWIAHLFMVTPV